MLVLQEGKIDVIHYTAATDNLVRCNFFIYVYFDHSYNIHKAETLIL